MLIDLKLLLKFKCFIIMESKKILICQTCNFYPTKAQSQEIQVAEQHIVWKCKACDRTNSFTKKWPVSLPSTDHLLTSVNNLLGKEHQSSLEHYYVIIKQGQNDQLLDQDLLYSKILRESLGQKYEKVQELVKLMQQSRLWPLLKKRKCALRKFISQQCRSERYFERVDYILCLLEKYVLFLKYRRQSRSIYSQSVKITIVVEQKSRNFVFSFDHWQLYKNESQLQNFILVYTLVSLKEIPEWLYNNYRTILNKYDRQVHFEQEIHQLLILANKKVELIKKPQIQQIILLNASMTVTNSQQIEYSPFSQSNIIQYLNDCLPKRSAYQRIVIFYRQRRKSKIYQYSLQDNIQNFKKILLSRPSLKKDDEVLLRNCLEKIIAVKTEKPRVQLVKLVAYLKQSESYQIVLFTFNWTKIESQQLTQSLQQPQNYQHILKQDIIPVEYCPITKAKTNPFAKKAVYEQICNRQTEQNEQKEDDQFISL